MATISIVVLNYHTYSAISTLLEVLYSEPVASDFEVIIIDQNKQPAVATRYYAQWRRHESLTVYPQETNLGFARGCNLGFHYSHGDYVLFLNSDAWIRPKGLITLVNELVDHPEAVAVGPVSNRASDVQTVYDWPPERDFHRMAEYLAFDWSKAEDSFEYHKLSGFCLLVRRAIFDRVKGFDEKFGLGYFEDDDLSSRLRRYGTLRIVPSVFVYHKDSLSFHRLGDTRAILMYQNRMRFLFKHHSRLLDPRTEGPLVSVVVTTYNRPELVVRAVGSILCQSYERLEVIVVNDGGSDIGEKLPKDERVCYVNNTLNQGKPKAANSAILRARGDLIAFLDDDDEWMTDHLLVAVNALSEMPEADAVYMASIVSKIHRGRILSQAIVSNEWNPERLLTSNYIPNLSLVVRRSVLDKVGLFADLPVLEDWDFVRRMAIVSHVVHIPLVTSKFYVRKDGKSRNGLLQKDYNNYLRHERSIRLGTPSILTSGDSDMPSWQTLRSRAMPSIFPPSFLSEVERATVRADMFCNYRDAVVKDGATVDERYLAYLAASSRTEQISALSSLLEYYRMVESPAVVARLYALMAFLLSGPSTRIWSGPWDTIRFVFINEGFGGVMNFLGRATRRRMPRRIR